MIMQSFLPLLKKLLRLEHEIASHLTYEKNPYDALLDLFEPSLTVKKTSDAFNAVKPDLIELTKRIQKSKEYTAKSDFYRWI